MIGLSTLKKIPHNKHLQGTQCSTLQPAHREQGSWGAQAGSSGPCRVVQQCTPSLLQAAWSACTYSTNHGQTV